VVGVICVANLDRHGAKQRVLWQDYLGRSGFLGAILPKIRTAMIILLRQLLRTYSGMACPLFKQSLAVAQIREKLRRFLVRESKIRAPEVLAIPESPAAPFGLRNSAASRGNDGASCVQECHW